MNQWLEWILRSTPTRAQSTLSQVVSTETKLYGSFILCVCFYVYESSLSDQQDRLEKSVSVLNQKWWKYVKPQTHVELKLFGESSLLYILRLYFFSFFFFTFFLSSRGQHKFTLPLETLSAVLWNILKKPASEHHFIVHLLIIIAVSWACLKEGK